MKTRDEHLAWCKERAIATLDRGDVSSAYASMVSDLREHPELEKHAAIDLGMMLMMGGHLSSQHEMRRFIEGFN